MASYGNTIKRKDSFGLEFNFYPTMECVGKFLDKMEVKVDTIEGIQNLSRNRVIVKMSLKHLC